jgi:hypothetical protein
MRSADTAQKALALPSRIEPFSIEDQATERLVIDKCATQVRTATILLLLADRGFGGLLPTVKSPRLTHPAVAVFGYGFFFGAIVALHGVVVFFSSDSAGSVLYFGAFESGIAAPLVARTVVFDRWQVRVLRTLTGYQILIN